MLIEHIVKYTISQKELQRLNIMQRYWKQIQHQRHTDHTEAGYLKT